MRIGICTTGLMGIVNASLELIDSLKKDGHEVVYFSPRDIREVFKDENVKFVELPEIGFNYQKAFSGILPALGNLKQQRLEQGAADLNISEIRRIIVRESLDQIIVDIELHEVILTSIAEGLKISVLTQWFCNRHFSSLPPLDTSVVPTGLRTRLMTFMKWRKRELSLLLKNLKNWFSNRISRREVLLYYARSIGYPVVEMLPSVFPPLFDYKTLPVVSLTMEEMEFPFKYPANLRYIGPVVYRNREDQAELPILLNDTMNQRDFEKLIYCSLSSHSAEDLSLVKKLLQAAGNLKQHLFVISLAKQNNTELIDLLSEVNNVLVFNWLPQLALLEQADLSINHGGIHTINECIVTSTPMLVYSGKMFDQNGCAARVHYHELGIMADKDIDTPKDIRRKIEAVLNTEKYRENIIRLCDISQRARVNVGDV